ncbi:hypothetical protein BDV32DRAFT_118122 [Aspergillus pseudonomiae]|nr:hypothetical protein BDV32DRAFT_118122 [Aspergillus pseudonomiae]
MRYLRLIQALKQLLPLLTLLLLPLLTLLLLPPPPLLAIKRRHHRLNRRLKRLQHYVRYARRSVEYAVLGRSSHLVSIASYGVFYPMQRKVLWPLRL